MGKITGHTTLTGLIGTPVEHSISPAMHNEAFDYHNLDYAYLAFDIQPNEVTTAVDGLKALGARGFNVTMPHKSAVFELMDHLSPAAEIIGAVNTVVNDHGILTGHTTDGIGYMQAAADAGHDLAGKKMTLLGAGGAAIAICVQAALDGMEEINIFNIKDQFWNRASDLARTIDKKTNCKVTLHDLDDKKMLNAAIADSHILTNGTTVGMAPNKDACIIQDFSAFHKDLVVSDIIYNPEETKLLYHAKQLGCSTFNGLHMLLYQGAEAFRLWTGKEMPVSLIKEKYFSR